MKKFTIILTVLIAITINANAQIPNNGFENWTTVGSHENPTGWTTCNSAGGPSYPVSKSADHYPVGVGNYSIKMTTDIVAIGIGNCGHGFAKTANYLGDWGPVFPIIGHPNSFCGYYKFLPQNNDTMMITAFLFQNGTVVASAILTSTVTASSWTSFNIPISSYTTADSAEIGFSAYFGEYVQYPAGPWGNSVMYIDNISFDDLITSVSEQTIENTAFSLYPNPASKIVTLNIDNINNEDLTLNIYSDIGALVKTEILSQNQQQINVSDLCNGIYMVAIKCKEWTEKHKLLIQR